MAQTLSVYTAKAWKMAAPGDARDPTLLQQVDRQVPVPGLRQVLVKVAAAALNPIDYLTAKGNGFGALPLFLGFDFAGTVEEAGAESGFEKGEEVFGDVVNLSDSNPLGGSLSEYILVPHDLITSKPAGISAADVSSLSLVGVTALDSLAASNTPPGGRVLVLGASGGVGTLAVQIYKAKGFYVIGVCSTKNRDMVLGLGADEVIDYKECDWSEKLSSDKVDTVFDFAPQVDGSTMLSVDMAKKVLKPQGAFVNLYQYPLSPSSDFQFSQVVRKPSGKKLQELAEMVEQGKLRPVVEKIYPFSDTIEAFEHLMGGRAVGKLVVSVP